MSSCLKMHTDADGYIWFQEGNEPATRERGRYSSLDASRDERIHRSSEIRVLGSRQNAPLIVSLYNARHVAGRRFFPRVYLGGPATFGQDETTQVEPALLFQRMADMELPASVGGWHTLSAADYITYLLVSELERQTVTRLVSDLLRVHPVWPAISFLPHADHHSVAYLVATIVDPRWHVNPHKPDRLSRLRNYLGLGTDDSLQYFQTLLSGPGHRLVGTQANRAATVLRAWSGGLPAVTPNDSEPSCFLHRAMEGCEPAKGLLRACRLFVRFLRDVWLDRLTPRRVYDQDPTGVRYLRPCRSYSPTLFVPEHFFRRKSEVDAWRQHVRRFPQGADA